MNVDPTPPRRSPIRSILVLPTMITMGNLLAGILALVYLQQAAIADDPAPLWNKAAWMIFLGMLCDALDGRVARWTQSTSAFGAQLDSLADVVTFGVVPTLLARSILAVTFPNIGPRLLTALVSIYVIGAALRLARYNVESARVSDAGEKHVTLTFRGLPSPAAAGTVASLVLLHRIYDLKHLDITLLLLTPLLGLLMISRVPYPHLANRLDGRRSLPAVVLLVLAVFVGVTHFEETISTVFVVYVMLGLLPWVMARLTGWPPWVLDEEDDEAPAEPPASRSG